MQIIEISKSGEVVPRVINRRTLITEFELHIRDLRPVFSVRQVTTILRRGQGIIINFKSVKMIIGLDRALIFNLENPRIVNEFVPMLSDKISTDTEEAVFEFVCLDTALSYITMSNRGQFEVLQRRTESNLKELEQEPSDASLTKLLHLKKQISKLESRSQESEDMVVEILEDDEDMKGLVLSMESNDEILEELESILENSLEQIENISHQIDELNENIDDTQEILTIKLASRRNDIIRFDLVISVMTAIFSIMAVLVGLFGTNIRNKLENNHTAFLLLSGFLVVLFFVLWIAIRRYMHKKELL